MLTECFSRRILRFTTSLIDLIQSERVSSSTSSFLAHCLAYASHASMIISKFWCHKNETGSLNFRPLRKRSLSLSFCTILRSPVTTWQHGSYRNSESGQVQGKEFWERLLKSIAFVIKILEATEIWYRSTESVKRQSVMTHVAQISKMFMNQKCHRTCVQCLIKQNTEVPRDVRNSKVRKQDKFRRDWSQQKNTCKSQSRTGPGVRRSKRPLMACRTRCKCSMETSRN